ncbi:hypothetical protein HKW90_11095 [Pseudomonas aeruginosa]|uniref:hypothetical protein n=1 Tax=Pseudomonas aeruginosa TaxID=287 RepID=UPI00093DEFD9|nr:hypothetical protein [Pseudomonas aeruginosa]MBF3054928.1 hypothetical protein [Pseudomonas aeruginosa]MDC9031643.1 hypothetical protein [Pseudomonas aeruginosa]RMJ72608.1 hypothetical protein IPC1268_23260 [Pseudomonas aeruginosa]TQH93649.1 hypothetical protein FLI92_17920 [Pseudomonas aeruginosa]TQI07670.1 hypothetical protein FLI93_31695 [Pseudomonas aeruginosa]
MTYQYKSEGEERYLAERKAASELQRKEISIKNTMLVGDTKEYKGISYQMNQRGNYQCVDLPPLSGLDGVFTSTQILHSIIDKLERDGNLPKRKK